MKHNTMETLSTAPLKDIIIRQTCVCEDIDKKAKRPTHVITEVEVGGELMLYSKMNVFSYNESYIKKALNLLLLGNKKNNDKIIVL